MAVLSFIAAKEDYRFAAFPGFSLARGAAAEEAPILPGTFVKDSFAVSMDVR